MFRKGFRPAIAREQAFKKMIDAREKKIQKTYNKMAMKIISGYLMLVIDNYNKKGDELLKTLGNVTNISDYNMSFEGEKNDVCMYFIKKDSNLEELFDIIKVEKDIELKAAEKTVVITFKYNKITDFWSVGQHILKNDEVVSRDNVMKIILRIFPDPKEYAISVVKRDMKERLGLF